MGREVWIGRERGREERRQKGVMDRREARERREEVYGQERSEERGWEKEWIVKSARERKREGGKGKREGGKRKRKGREGIYKKGRARMG